MFKLLGKLDKTKKYYVAFSGGKDSVAFTHYLLSKGFNITLLHFHHNISVEDENAYNFTKQFAKEYCLELIVDILNKPKDKQQSPEEYQRIHRYKFLNKFNDAQIIMCHNLNDNAETWLFGSINGQSKLIPYSNNNIIRPFMLNNLETISNYLISNSLTHYEDTTNKDTSIPRNYIRHLMMPQVLDINKGFLNMIRKRIIKKYNREYLCH